jgi:hypothetical protein
MAYLRNIFINIAVFGLIFTVFTVFITQMANESIYAVTVNQSDLNSFRQLNQSVDEMHSLSSSLQRAGESVSRGDVFQSVYLLPQAAVDIFRMPFSAMTTANNITTEVATYVGIPRYALAVLYVIIIVTIAFLVINAIGRRYSSL